VEPTGIQWVPDFPPPPPPLGAAPGSLPTGPVRGSDGPAPKRPRTRLLVASGAIVVIIGIVIGAALGERGRQPEASVSPSASMSPSSPPPIVAPPVGFSAKGQADPFGVLLTWSPPVGQPVQGYRIFRAGVQVAAVPSATTTYMDSNVTPGETYTYEILTRGEGLFQSSRVAAQVFVPVPSLSSARLDGSFDVKLKTTSQSGYDKSLGTLTLVWNFTSRCDQGACDVTMKDFSIKDLKTTLVRHGVDYSGTDGAASISSCGSVPQASTLTLKLHVVQADVIDVEWRATRLEGTVVERHPSAFGCAGGETHFDVTATFLS
jgi:fibronectin type III domain protein